MIRLIRELLLVEECVTLRNEQGYLIEVNTIAISDIGVYTIQGEFYSRCRLSVEHYTLIK